MFPSPAGERATFPRCVAWCWPTACCLDCREMQQHVAALQAELKAAQAAADLEATLLEFKKFIDNGQHHHTQQQQTASRTLVSNVVA